MTETNEALVTDVNPNVPPVVQLPIPTKRSRRPKVEMVGGAAAVGAKSPKSKTHNPGRPPLADPTGETRRALVQRVRNVTSTHETCVTTKEQVVVLCRQLESLLSMPKEEQSIVDANDTHDTNVNQDVITIEA